MEHGARIRPITPADHQAVLDIYAPYIRQSPISFEYEVPSLNEFSRRIGEVTTVYPWLVAEVNGRLVGYAYAGRHRSRQAYDWSAEASVYLDPEFQRRGIAQRLYQTLFGILRLQGVVNLYAGITIPNRASESFHASMGFTDVGVYRNVGYKAGSWHDVKWMVLFLRDHPGNPVGFVSWRQVEKTRKFVSLFS